MHYFDYSKYLSFIYFSTLLATAQPAIPDTRGPDELEAMQTVTTATRSERLLNNVPIRTELLSPEIFAAAGTPDLSAAIEYLSGARVEANCQNCGTAEVKLQGLGAAYNQILFDSQPLFGGLASVYGLEQIPTAFIDRIEVVKGGASTLYGPGAVAGVINIIPHEPVVSRIDFEASFESYDGEPAYRGSAVLDWVSSDQNYAASFYSEYRQSDAADLNDDGFSDITDRELTTVGGYLWAYPIDDGKLSLNYAYTEEDRRGGDRFDLVPHETQITEALEHAWHRGGIAWDHQVNPDFNYRLAASFSDISRDSYYGGVGVESLPGQPSFDPVSYAAAVEEAKLLYGFTETTRIYFDSLFSYDFGEHILIWGLQYLEDEVFDEKRDDLGQPLRTDGTIAERSGEDPIAEGDFDNLGIYIQNEWDPTDAMTLVTGVRADKHSDIDDWILSPRAAVRYRATSDLTFRASVATGFRAPEIFNEDFHIEILDDPTRTRNVPGLTEESSTSWGAGFVWIPSAADNKLQIDVEFYRTEIEDTFNVSDIVFTDSNGDAFKLRENAGGSAVQGFEANVMYRINDQFWFDAGVAYNDARFDERQEVLDGIVEDRFLENPEWTGVAQLNYTNHEVFDAFLGLIYTGPMVVLAEGEGRLNESTDHFFVVDFSITKHINIPGQDFHLDLTVGVRNLFDERQDDLTSGPDRDTTYFYGPRFPRSFFVSARMHF